jgi:ADP-ribose pyrophosphatase
MRHDSLKPYIPEEHVISSSTIYKGTLLSLKSSIVRLPNGKTCIREVVEHRGAVVIIPILGRKIILIQQFRLPAGKALYELPAGTIYDDESPEKCAEREIVEETGYKAGKILKVFQCYLAPGYSTELVHFFVATELEPLGQLLEEDEVINVCPVFFEEALSMVENNLIEDAKTALGILLYDRLIKFNDKLKSLMNI